MLDNIGQFSGLDDESIPTEEEREAVLALMDEIELSESEHEFIYDLAGMGDTLALTGPQRVWLEQLIEKYNV